MNYDIANQIVDTLIIYTEAMAFYALLAMLVLHIDKWLSIHSTPNFVTNKQPLLTAVAEPKALPQAAPLFTHHIVPLVRKQSNRHKYHLMTCGQLRSYLRDHGYGKLSKLRKHELVALCEAVWHEKTTAILYTICHQITVHYMANSIHNDLDNQ